MFKQKKILNIVNCIFNSVSSMSKRLIDIENKVSQFNESVKYIKDTSPYKRTIESQQRTIKILTEALCNKFSNGFFIVSDGGEFPMVIRNGKELTDDLTTSISIKWDINNCPDIDISQSSITSIDDEIYENESKNT